MCNTFLAGGFVKMADDTDVTNEMGVERCSSYFTPEIVGIFGRGAVIKAHYAPNT